MTLRVMPYSIAIFITVTIIRMPFIECYTSEHHSSERHSADWHSSEWH